MSQNGSFRQSLIKVQRRILNSVRRDIRSTLGPHAPGLARYERVYRRRVDQTFTIEAREDLLKACDRAQIIYVGDYHTLGAAQDFARVLLQTLIERTDHEWTLAMEMLQVSDQSACDRYLADEIDEEQFLREIEYEKNWGFDWNNFRPLFDFAQENGVPIIGINCDVQVRQASLVERDTCAAMAIAHEAANDPERKFLVLDGDMHIAPQHLPQRVNAYLRELKTSRRSVIIYQNSEEVHWKLVEKGRERDVDVVRFNAREHCVQHTHPIVKLQSYLNWLEYEEELAGARSAQWADEVDADRTHEDQVQQFVDSIAKTLGIRGADLTDFTVYSVEDLNFLDHLKDVHIYSNDEIGLVFIQILKGESTFLPDGHMIYLGNLTVNHAAEEAAHYVNFKVSGPPPKVESREHDFYHRTMREALGFFGSKIINSSRLAYRIADFIELEQELLGKRLDTKGRDLRKIVRVVLHHHGIERSVQAGKRLLPENLPKMYFQEHSVTIGAVHALGYRLGLWLFSALEEGIVTTEEIRALFELRFEEEHSARDCYFDLLSRLKDVKVPYEKRRERF
jgi:uncharacterized iron-regulated protein